VKWDYAERRRRERNYRVMFKIAIVGALLGFVVTLFGGAEAMTDADGEWLMLGLFLFVWSVISGWLTVDSTVTILELDASEGVLRSEAS
jgi:hypothetical protein